MNNSVKKFFFPTWWFVQGVYLLYFNIENWEIFFVGILLVLISIIWPFPLRYFIRILFLALLIVYSFMSIIGGIIMYSFSMYSNLWITGLLFSIPILNIIISIAYLIKQK